ncbi:hypothetical protein PVK06_002608 [Gossypium arboreum]|uniref:Uncharacterized protein n=1 Tax=Gossypium arboreum TaxID=29729 RepID=A0ABR0R416_GOSAR|nr:hypothetical protein PVK06_002608 [Gossypium arboreum]
MRVCMKRKQRSDKLWEMFNASQQQFLSHSLLTTNQPHGPLKMAIMEIEQALGWRDQSSNPQGKFQATSTRENSQGCLHPNILRRIPALIHPAPVTYISQSIKKNLSPNLAQSYLNLPARSSTFRDSCSRIQVSDLSSCRQGGVALPSFSIQPPLDSGKPASNLQDDTLANSDGDG